MGVLCCAFVFAKKTYENMPVFRISKVACNSIVYSFFFFCEVLKMPYGTLAAHSLFSGGF